MNGTLTIKPHQDEREFMETCLNLSASGVNCILTLLFQALGEGWHVDKLNYYRSLIIEARTIR